MFTIGTLSIAHMLVDFLCALAIFGKFLDASGGGMVLLLYNFCAFALQMPLGVLLDSWNMRAKTRMPGALFTITGIILTVFGAFSLFPFFLSPIIIGLGNAFFHVGGGVLSIEDDNFLELKGRGLGVFVAPGAIGLFWGTYLGNTAALTIPLIVGSVLAVIMGLLILVHMGSLSHGSKEKEFIKAESAKISAAPKLPEKKEYLMIAPFFFVVLLRSFVGSSVTFPWKEGLLLLFLSVLAVASGKTAGGFLAAKIGPGRASLFSLVASAICFALYKNIAFGIMGLFFFNMTMPITLYGLQKKLPGMPGLSFGILTFALFVGILPILGGLTAGASTPVLGIGGSLLSALFLVPALGYEKR